MGAWPYTATQLNAYYQALTGVAPDAATTLAFQAYANQDAAGTQSDAQTLALVFNSVGVQNTFEVAESTYQFFTGATTTQAGLQFLEGTAGSGNANGLTTTYYNGTGGSITAPTTSNGFNTENRYYNFAINLASAGGAGNASFTAAYGSLTFAQTVAAAYENIVGSANVGTANANAAIADITSRQGFFQQIAATRGGDATALSNPNASLTLKAVVVGYILEEANKADVGTYAKAIDQFEASVAQGNAIFNTNALTTYGPGGAGYNTGVGLTGTTGTTGQTLAFTSGTDTFNTTAGNVTFVGQVGGTAAGVGGTSATLGPSDIVNAQGANNTLITNVVTTGGAIPAGGLDASGGAILNGIQTIDVRSADGTAAQLNQSSVAQATALNSYLSTGTVTFNNVAGSTTVGIIGNGTVQGGSLVANYVSGGTENVALTGGTLSNATAGAGTATNVTITGPAASTIALTSSGFANSIDAFTANNATTLNITANQALTIAATTTNALATLNVTGTGAVDLGGTALANTVRTVTSTDTGGLRASFTTTGAAGALNITTSATGADRITLDNAAANTVVNTGGGGDVIQVNGTITAGASLNGSGGATLAVTTADYTGVSGFTAANRALITGFSTLGIIDPTGLTNGTTYDVNLIGAQNFTSYGAAAGTTATVNAVSGAIITTLGTSAGGTEQTGGTVNINLAGATAATSTNDSLTLGFSGQAANEAQTFGTTGVETIQVIANRSAATVAAAGQPVLTLGLNETAAATTTLNTVTFAGNERVAFAATAGDFALRTVSATADTANLTLNVAAVPATNGVAGGSPSATFGITLTGGSGVDTLTFRDFAKVTGGAGADFFQAARPTSGQTYSSVLDAQAGDHISFATAAGAVESTGTFTPATQPAAITLAATAVFQDYLDAAVRAGTTTGGAGQVNYFQYQGNTYVVEENSGATTFQNGTDAVVQLTGIHTLAGTSAAGVFVLGS